MPEHSDGPDRVFWLAVLIALLVVACILAGVVLWFIGGRS